MLCVAVCLPGLSADSRNLPEGQGGGRGGGRGSAPPRARSVTLGDVTAFEDIFGVVHIKVPPQRLADGFTVTIGM